MAVIQKAKLTAYSASIFRAWEGGTIRLNEIGIFSLPQADWFSILRQKWRSRPGDGAGSFHPVVGDGE
ncbi:MULTISPECIES: hypothetical protein, partial [unclassified Mesorhizobium]